MAKKPKTETQHETLTLASFLELKDTQGHIMAFKTAEVSGEAIIVAKLASLGAIMGGIWSKFSAVRAGENTPRLTLNMKEVAPAIASAMGLNEASVKSYVSLINKGINPASKTHHSALYEACAKQSRAEIASVLNGIGKTYLEIRKVLAPSKAGGAELSPKAKLDRKVKTFITTGGSLPVRNLKLAIDALADEFGLRKQLIALWTEKA